MGNIFALEEIAVINSSHFEKEAKALQNRLKICGYSNKSLKKAYARAKKHNRSDLIHGQKTPTSTPELRMITRFSGQHKQIRELMQKYWYLLMGDPRVSKHLKNYPEITFRRSQSIKDRIVHSHYDPSPISTSSNRGTRPCHKCDFCRYIHATRTIALPNGRLYAPKFAVTCQSVGIVYLMTCGCNAFYVGKAKRPFFHRIRDHVSLVCKKRMETPISRHMGLFHKFDDTMMRFVALEYVPPGERGGNYDQILLQREAKWISNLDALKAPGLNDAFSYKPFL